MILSCASETSKTYLGHQLSGYFHIEGLNLATVPEKTAQANETWRTNHESTKEVNVTVLKSWKDKNKLLALILIAHLEESAVAKSSRVNFTGISEAASTSLFELDVQLKMMLNYCGSNKMVIDSLNV